MIGVDRHHRPNNAIHFDFLLKAIRCQVPDAELAWPQIKIILVLKVLGLRTTCQEQSIVVENRPGGALTTGLSFTAKSEPDGYTIAMGPIGALATEPEALRLPRERRLRVQDRAVSRDRVIRGREARPPFLRAVQLRDPGDVADIVEYLKSLPNGESSEAVQGGDHSARNAPSMRPRAARWS